MTRLPRLRSAERRLVQAVLGGSNFNGLSLFPARDEVVVRAEVLRGLLLGLMGVIEDPLGVRVSNVVVDGSLRLDYATLELPLELTSTTFTDGIVLLNAKIKWLSLERSTFPQLDAGGLEVESNLSLRDVCVHGQGRRGPAVRLSGARVRGTVWLERMTASHVEEAALVANRANIDGALALEEATLRSEGGRGALRAIGLHVGGSVFATGLSAANAGRGPAVRLSSSRVGEDLLIDKATLRAVQGVALDVVGLHCGGDLSLRNAHVEAEGGCALDADRARIGGRLWVEDSNFSGSGRPGVVRIAGAHIGDSVRARNAVVENTDGPAIYADHAVIEGAISLTRGFRALGRGNHAAARLGGVRCRYIDLTDGQFLNPEGPSLDFRQAELDALRIPGSVACQSVTDEGAWLSDGFMLLDGLTFKTLTEPSATLTEWLAWLRRLSMQSSFEFANQPYGHLARLFAEAGRVRESREVATARYEDLRASGRLGFWRGIANRTLGVSIGHGYKPFRSVYALVALLVLTVSLVYGGVGQGLFTPVGNTIPTGTNVQTCAADYPCLSPIFYSIETVFPLLDLHQGSFWQPSQATTEGRLLATWLRVAALLGWVLATLAVSAFVSLARLEL